MRPIEPYELSGFLDGEIEPERGEEIHRAIETDGDLRAEFNRLRALDKLWAAAATGAMFKPNVTLPIRGVAIRPRLALTAGLAILLVFQLLFKLAFSFSAAVTVSFCVLIGLSVILVWANGRLDKESGGLRRCLG